MAEMIETRDTPRKEHGFNPDLIQIARYMEEHARVLQETGWSDDATHLRRWAQELRRKSSEAGT